MTLTRRAVAELTVAKCHAAPTKWDRENLLYKLRCRANAVAACALRDGVLTKPSACSECGAEGRVEMHHDDYDAPLAVRFLCRPCHRAADVARRARERRLKIGLYYQGAA